MNVDVECVPVEGPVVDGYRTYTPGRYRASVSWRVRVRVPYRLGVWLWQRRIRRALS